MSETEAATAEIPEAPTTTTATEETTDPATGADDLTAEVEKWKTQARKNEQRAKANADAAKELEKLKREGMSDQERAVEEARAAARAEALAEVGSERAADAIRLAAKGRVSDVEALIEGIDATRFLGEDGKPDREAIAAWVDRIAPPADENAPPAFPDLAQGPRRQATTSDPLLDSLNSALGNR
jgi:hypothetical protein